MNAFVRKNATYISVIVMSWFGYSELSGSDEEKQVAKAKMEGFADAALERRRPGESVLVRRDPLGVEIIVPPVGEEEDNDFDPLEGLPLIEGEPAAEVEGGWVSPHPHAVSAVWFGAVGEATKATVGTLTGLIESFAPEPEPEPEPVELPPLRTFVMRLESTLVIGGSKQARISGRTVALGEEIPGLDPDTPPVLTEVTGVSVIVEHRGDTYFMDLNSTPTLRIGPAEPEQLINSSDPMLNALLQHIGSQASAGDTGP